ncbi:MAG: dihydropteridine reductase [Oscillospiraceae bacterium]|nr:dihydropteridine reductase [Oscillospiraceae bacterium]
MNKNDTAFLAQKIRAQYTDAEKGALTELRKLDAKVKRPANIFAYAFGTIGALTLGTGMSFAIDAIAAGTYFGITIGENMMLPGIIIGLIGILIVSVNFPVYKKLLSSRKKKYASEILRLSENIINE